MVGVAQLRSSEGFDAATCIGGWLLAISLYGEGTDAAWRLLEYLAGPDRQRTLAVEASNIPAREPLHDDPAVLAAAPHVGDVWEVIVNARSRPVTPFYADVSQAIRSPVNALFARQVDAEEAPQEMQRGVDDALDF